MNAPISPWDDSEVTEITPPGASPCRELTGCGRIALGDTGRCARHGGLRRMAGLLLQLPIVQRAMRAEEMR